MNASRNTPKNCAKLYDGVQLVYVVFGYCGTVPITVSHDRCILKPYKLIIRGDPISRQFVLQAKLMIFQAAYCVCTVHA